MAKGDEVEIALEFDNEEAEKQWFDLSTLEQREDLMSINETFRGLPLVDQGVLLAKLNRKEVKPIIQDRLAKELGLDVKIVGNRLVPVTKINPNQKKILKTLEKAIDAGATVVGKTLDVLFGSVPERLDPKGVPVRLIDTLVGLENLEFLKREVPTKLRKKFRAIRADQLQKETTGVIGKIARTLDLPQRLLQNVLVEFVALNLEILDSPAFILSFAPGGVGSQKILQASKLALGGQTKQAARVLTEAVRVRSLKDVARKTVGEVTGVAGGVSELLTGFTPVRRGPISVGGATLLPVIQAAGRGIARVGEQIPVSARGAEAIRRFTAPGVSLGAEATIVVPKAPTNVTQLVREAFGKRGAALTQAARPGVQPALFRMQTESEAVFREAAKEVAFLNANKLSRVESQLASEAVEQGIARDRLNLGKFKGSLKSQIVALRVGSKLGEVGRELVKAGFDSRGVKRLMDRYLTRIYSMHEIPLADSLNPFVRRARRKKATIRLAEAERLLARRDLSKAERRRLGEILEVEPRFIKGLITGKQLAAFGRLQQELSRVPGAVRKRPPGPNWIQLSRTPRIIKRLQGKWVEFENAREVFAWDDLARELSSPDFDKKLLRFTKEILTVDNPVVWTGNIGFNFFIADANRLGGPAGFIPFLLRSTKDMVREGKLVSPKLQQAIDDGVFGSGFQDRKSFRQVLGKHVLESKETSGHMLAMELNSVAYRKNSLLRASATGVRDFFRNWYKSQDDIFRFWAYDDGLRIGLTRQQASARARTMFVDYSDIPVAMRRVGGQIGTGSALLSPQPFISWQYSMTPQMMKAMVENPMALARWRHFLDAYNTAALVNQGKDPQLVEAYKEAQILQARSPREKFFAKNVPYLVAWKPSAAGDTMITSVSRFSPLGDAAIGRIFSFNPIQNAFLSTIFDRQIFGTELGPTIPEGELAQNIGKIFSLPAPIIRSALQQGLVSRAKINTETGEPENLEAKLLFWAFGRSAIPKTRPFLTPGERFGQAFTGRFKPVDIEQERQRALDVVLRKGSETEKAIEDRQTRAVILREIQRLAAEQGQQAR